MTAQIEVTPAEALVDEDVHIRLTQLKPNALVSLHAEMQDDSSTTWRSSATFQADDSGVVDLTSHSPVSGSYTGVEPMGFLWSMEPAGVKPAEASPFAKVALDPSTIELTAVSDGDPPASTTLTRLYVHPDVTRTSVRDDGLVGAFFEPAGAGPFPAIIVIGGSGGGLSELSAALYASRGIAALALAYFRAEHLPEDLLRIPLEYFETAMRWVREHEAVDADRLAVAGASRGGELVLLLGSRYPEIKAVVANVPSSVVFGGIAQDSQVEGHLQPAWTYRGEGVPFLKSTRGNAVEESKADPDEPYALTPMFLRSMEDEAQVEQVSIPVEKIQAPVLLVSGKEDAMWPSAMFSERVMARLAEHSHPYEDRHLAYDGAGHLIGQPHVPTTVNYSMHPVTNTLFAFGGNPRDSAHARVDAWSSTLQFLSENL